MRLGYDCIPTHSVPEEWAEKIHRIGVRAIRFPVNYTASQSLIDGYVKEARARDILIAEVGIWKSPHLPDKKKAAEARKYCEEQFRLADYVGARCAVNVSGAAGPVWHGCYAENYSEELYKRNVAFLQELCDKVKPERTYYCLEVMQWMLPDSPAMYKRVLKDVNREHFGVHMDAVNFMNAPYRYTHQREVMDEAFDLPEGKLRSCHLKDCILEKGITVSIKETFPGEGGFDLPYYLKKAEEQDADLPVLIEHLYGEEEYERAFCYVKELLAKEDGEY